SNINELLRRLPSLLIASTKVSRYSSVASASFPSFAVFTYCLILARSDRHAGGCPRPDAVLSRYLVVVNGLWPVWPCFSDSLVKIMRLFFIFRLIITSSLRIENFVFANVVIK
ncbi:unnamed protein product, partial [Amoebophrya sp. A25]